MNSIHSLVRVSDDTLFQGILHASDDLYTKPVAMVAVGLSDGALRICANTLDPAYSPFLAGRNIIKNNYSTGIAGVAKDVMGVTVMASSVVLEPSRVAVAVTAFCGSVALGAVATYLIGIPMTIEEFIRG